MEDIQKLKILKKIKYNFNFIEKELNHEINSLEEKLYKSCEHIWEYDDGFCCSYDRRDYICKKCNLNKNKRFYPKKKYSDKIQLINILESLNSLKILNELFLKKKNNLTTRI